MDVHGSVDKGFEPVAAALRANFAEHGDIGAAVCVYHRGQPVVDLWGGDADREAGRSWEEDTIQLVFSTTKGMAATCVHLLVERGELDLDDPVALHWPEFAAGGKADIPLRWVLTHEAGLAARLGDLQTPRDQLPALAADATNQWTGTFNPLPLAERDFLALYEAAY